MIRPKPALFNAPIAEILCRPLVSHFFNCSASSFPCSQAVIPPLKATCLPAAKGEAITCKAPSFTFPVSCSMAILWCKTSLPFSSAHQNSSKINLPRLGVLSVAAWPSQSSIKPCCMTLPFVSATKYSQISRIFPTSRVPGSTGISSRLRRGAVSIPWPIAPAD